MTDVETPLLSNVNRVMLLREADVFRAITSYELLENLASTMEEVHFPAGTTIFNQDDEGRQLYILAEGRVKIHLGDIQLGELGRGAFFGEMSLFDAKPRSASVTTLKDSLCLILTQAQMFELIEENPGIERNIIRTLCERVRVLNHLASSQNELSRRVHFKLKNSTSTQPTS